VFWPVKFERAHLQALGLASANPSARQAWTFGQQAASTNDDARPPTPHLQVAPLFHTPTALTSRARGARAKSRPSSHQNGTEYIFLDAKDDVNELTTFMKGNETDGAKSVHFVFPNDTSDGPQTSNDIAINVSGFSNGFEAFQMACASSQ
jgi:hypothetical protein